MRGGLDEGEAMVVKAPSRDPDSERSLLAAARVGDPQAFDALVEPHRREIHLHCYRMTGSLTDADDLVQESLLKAWRRIGPSRDGRRSAPGCTGSPPTPASTS